MEFTWDTGDAPESVVRCGLTRDGDATRLIFMHKGVGFVWIGLALPGWRVHLERLAGMLDGAAQPMSMPRWRELQTIYLDRYKLDGAMIDPPPGHGAE
ncbi:MAG: hypothetical protein ABSE69_10235 [Roseiarcus sp.]